MAPSIDTRHRPHRVPQKQSLDFFNRHARRDGEKKIVIADENAAVLVHVGREEKAGPFDRLEMGHERLSETCLECMTEGRVRWGLYCILAGKFEERSVVLS